MLCKLAETQLDFPTRGSGGKLSVLCERSVAVASISCSEEAADGIERDVEYSHIFGSLSQRRYENL